MLNSTATRRKSPDCGISRDVVECAYCGGQVALDPDGDLACLHCGRLIAVKIGDGVEAEPVPTPKRETPKERYQRRIQEGRCYKCGSRRDATHDTRIVAQGLCQYHLEKAQATSRKRCKRRYAESKAVGQCTQCHQRPARVGYITCQPCGDFVAEKGREYWRTHKRVKCAACEKWHYPTARCQGAKSPSI